jgi:hypothetical protein
LRTHPRLIFLFPQKICPGFGPFRSGGLALTGEHPGIASEIHKISDAIFVLTTEIPDVIFVGAALERRLIWLIMSLFKLAYNFVIKVSYETLKICRRTLKRKEVFYE